MLRRILIGGLVGGILGGALVAVVQGFTTDPLILQAETFETASAHGALVHLVHAHGHAVPAEQAGDPARFMLTLVATIAVATGYAWMLLAAMAARGAAITSRSVLPWAVAAFFAAGLAPAFGLPPELPGAAAADLNARQLWWLFTAASTAGGLAAVFLGRTNMWSLVGIVALVLPHLVGAPHPDAVSGSVPAELAAQFVSASLVIQLLVWVVPAVIAGFVVSRKRRRVRDPEAMRHTGVGCVGRQAAGARSTSTRYAVRIPILIHVHYMCTETPDTVCEQSFSASSVVKWQG